MKIISVCFCFLAALSCFSQNSKIDSLQMLLYDNKLDDFKRLEVLINLSNLYVNDSPEEGLKVAEQAIVLAERLEDKPQKALATKYKAYNLESLNEYSKGIQAYADFITLQKEIEDWEQVGKGFFNSSLMQYDLNNYQAALAYNDSAYKYFLKQKDTLLMSVALNSKGINLTNLNLYPEAIEAYLSSINLFENSTYKNSVRHAQALNNIGLLYKRLEDYDEAFKAYEEAISIYKIANDKYGLSDTYANLGAIYDIKNEHKKAINYYNKSLQIKQSISHTYGIASAYTNIGIAYSNLKVYDSAKAYFNNAIRIWDEIDHTTNLAISYESLGEAFLQMANEGISTEKNSNTALLNFNKAYDLASKLEDNRRIYSSLENTSKTYYLKRDYEKAYDNLKKSIAAKEQFLSKDKIDEIAMYKAKSEYEKKELQLNISFEKEKAKRDAEIQRQKVIKNSLFFGISGILVFGYFGFILFKKRQEAKRRALQAEFDFKVSDTELKALRNQMDPHFISNSLNSINDYISNNDIQNASEYLIKFSKFVRDTLEKSSVKEIQLSEEIQILTHYMDIEMKRFEESFEYEFVIQEGINPENILIPPMMLQPFVENSINHGFSDIDYKGKILISYSITNGMLVCSVDDNGKGSKDSLLSLHEKHKKSMSIEITKGRIEIINKLKNTNASLEFGDKTDGFNVTITLPLIEQF